MVRWGFPPSPNMISDTNWTDFQMSSGDINSWMRPTELYCTRLVQQSSYPAPHWGAISSPPPSRFLAISSKPMQVSPPNLQYPLSQQFYTLCKNFKVQGIIVRPQMTSELRHILPISTKNKGLRESPPRVQFKATINLLIRNDVELVGLQNMYLGFSKF